MPPSKEIIDSNENIDSNGDSKQPVLVLDLIRLILERLSFVDFHRARCVSSVWYSASKSCIGRVTNPTNPWIILFPKEHVESNNKGSCKLFDPSDHNSYTVRNLGFDFATSRCLASSGSWFLLLDHRTDFHLLNVFTRERIPLPSLESTDGKQLIFKRISDSDFVVTLHYKYYKYKDCGTFSYTENNISIGKTVLWVDEKSRDYLVVWSYQNFFAYHKRGDDDNNSWKVFEPLKNRGCVDMVFKESKLYVLRVGSITIFDFSHGESPMECPSFQSPHWYHNQVFDNLAVTSSGEVLIISSKERRLCHCHGIYFLITFTVHKMDPKSSKWSIIKSLGDEALFLHLGKTVAAKDGVAKNCIYFSNDQFRRYDDDNGIYVYNIQTEMSTHLTASSPIPFKYGRWFFPTFGGKLLL